MLAGSEGPDQTTRMLRICAVNLMYIGLFLNLQSFDDRSTVAVLFCSYIGYFKHVILFLNGAPVFKYSCGCLFMVDYSISSLKMFYICRDVGLLRSRQI